MPAATTAVTTAAALITALTALTMMMMMMLMLMLMLMLAGVMGMKAGERRVRLRAGCALACRLLDPPLLLLLWHFDRLLLNGQWYLRRHRCCVQSEGDCAVPARKGAGSVDVPC